MEIRQEVKYPCGKAQSSQDKNCKLQSDWKKTKNPTYNPVSLTLHRREKKYMKTKWC